MVGQAPLARNDPLRVSWDGVMTSMAFCRFCGTTLHQTFVDLGMSPLCESYVSRDHLNQMEPFYPLHVYVCGKCFLVQLEEYVTPSTSLPNTPTSPRIRIHG